MENMNKEQLLKTLDGFTGTENYGSFLNSFGIITFIFRDAEQIAVLVKMGKKNVSHISSGSFGMFCVRHSCDSRKNYRNVSKLYKAKNKTNLISAGNPSISFSGRNA
ncbi:MAG: hypothetical protein BWY26_01259 [Elusimicrobia bacterium ADurb.Bin231]|nr:MAG: hypothetical protein BWY26_01259 [Elusimicrobia bacterium ADurb.Bin231]